MPSRLSNFNQSLILPNQTIIVGLSGGPDSVCLLHKLCSLRSKLNLKLIAVHLNHEWSKEAQISADFCTKVCNELGVDLFIKKASELKFDPKWNGSLEEQGRKMRRHFFEKSLQVQKADAIALGHHRQDQHETFFIRLIRGSSLAGLTGMKEDDGSYIRPLLSCSKQEILDYCDAHLLEYYTDPSNESHDFLRNRIRNTVIPALHEIDTRFAQNLDQTISHLQATEQFLQQTTKQTINDLTSDDGMLDIAQFLKLHQIMQQRIIMHLLIHAQAQFTPSAGILKEIIRFLQNSKSTKHTMHDSWSIIKEKSYFKIGRNKKLEKTL